MAIRLALEDGPLGFELEGPRVVAVTNQATSFFALSLYFQDVFATQGQAEQKGLRPGAQLVAVGGEAIPAPPSEAGQRPHMKHQQQVLKT